MPSTPDVLGIENKAIPWKMMPIASAESHRGVSSLLPVESLFKNGFQYSNLMPEHSVTNSLLMNQNCSTPLTTHRYAEHWRNGP